MRGLTAGGPTALLSFVLQQTDTKPDCQGSAVFMRLLCSSTAALYATEMSFVLSVCMSVCPSFICNAVEGSFSFLMRFAAAIKGVP